MARQREGRHGRPPGSVRVARRDRSSTPATALTVTWPGDLAPAPRDHSSAKAWPAVWCAARRSPAVVPTGPPVSSASSDLAWAAGRSEVSRVSPVGGIVLVGRATRSAWVASTSEEEPAFAKLAGVGTIAKGGPPTCSRADPATGRFSQSAAARPRLPACAPTARSGPAHRQTLAAAGGAGSTRRRHAVGRARAVGHAQQRAGEGRRWPAASQCNGAVPAPIGHTRSDERAGCLAVRGVDSRGCGQLVGAKPLHALGLAGRHRIEGLSGESARRGRTQQQRTAPSANTPLSLSLL